MDSITHTLFGLVLYGAVDKRNLDKNHKRAYLVTTVGASVIPDIDVISRLWDTSGQYQMWHRGITHSIFLTPLWAALFFLSCAVIFKIKDKRLFLQNFPNEKAHCFSCGSGQRDGQSFLFEYIER